MSIDNEQLTIDNYDWRQNAAPVGRDAPGAPPKQPQRRTHRTTP
jgi:hypothetical protein